MLSSKATLDLLVSLASGTQPELWQLIEPPNPIRALEVIDPRGSVSLQMSNGVFSLASIFKSHVLLLRFIRCWLQMNHWSIIGFCPPFIADCSCSNFQGCSTVTKSGFMSPKVLDCVQNKEIQKHSKLTETLKDSPNTMDMRIEINLQCKIVSFTVL